MDLDTGWHPTIEEYHALAGEGVVSSSMLNDLVPPSGRPRLYKGFYIDKTRSRQLVGVDAWRGTIVDSVLTEGGSVGYLDDLGCRGFRDGEGRAVAVIPPKVDLRTKVGKAQWKAWKEACEREGLGLIGMSTDARGKEKRDLQAANDLLDEVEAIADFIERGATPAAELARELLQGDSGVSQLSHRFTWNGIGCRWRPDRLVEWDPGALLERTIIEDLYAQSPGSPVRIADYAHVSLKVTKDAHPGPFWANYQKNGWAMRDAFYELGWSALVAERAPADSSFPWLCGELQDNVGNLVSPAWTYAEEEPLDWIVVAAHHKPVPEVYVHVVPEKQRRRGRKRCSEALQFLKHCLETDDWTLPEERGAQLGREPRTWEWNP